MSGVLRAGWEFHPNETRATLHVDCPMFSCWRYSSESERSKLSDAQGKLMEVIEGIPGVREASVSKYQISIQRGGVFSWDEIMPHVESAVASYAERDGVERCDRVAAGL